MPQNEGARLTEAWDQIVIYATNPDDDCADLFNIVMSWIAHVDGVSSDSGQELEAAIERQRERSLKRQAGRDSVKG